MQGLKAGFEGAQGKENESQARIKKFMTMMDSMTEKELDSPNPKIFDEQSRLLRIARGSGCHPLYVKELVGACPWFVWWTQLSRLCVCM